MRTRSILAVLLALLLALAFAPQAAAEEDPDIFGTVSDALTGEPIAGAEVWLFAFPDGPGGPGPVEGTDTDEHGSYAFFDIDQKIDFVMAAADSYEQHNVDVDYDGTAPLEVDIDLYPTAGNPAVAGAITDALTGQPVLGETGVFLIYADAPREHALAYGPEEGTFEFYRVDVDRDFWVEAGAPGYLMFRSGIHRYDGTQTVQVDVRLFSWFSDVGEGHAHYEGILWAAGSGVTTGFPDGTFQPNEPVIRGQMATFLARALALPAGQATFSDVPPTHTHAGGIAAVADAGITVGFPDGTFRPNEPVTRGQMATFLARALDLPAGQASFPDVPADHTHAAGIAAIADAGITAGFPDGTFRPGDPVSRGQMATFLMRALAAGPALSVYGTVTDAETGDPMADVTVWYPDGMTTTDSDGAYAVFGLEAGEYVLTAAAPDRHAYQDSVSAPFTYDGTNPVELNFALIPMTGPADVTGTVTDADTGEPIEGAEVSLWWEDSDDRWPSVPTDADGVYGLWAVDTDREFRLRVAGPWLLEEWPGWDAPEIYVSDVYTYDGEETLVIDIELDSP